MSPHKLMYLNTLFLAGGAVGEDYKTFGMHLLEEVCGWGLALRF